MRAKKAVAWLLCLVLAVGLLAGCGGKGKDDTPQGGGGDGAAATQGGSPGEDGSGSSEGGGTSASGVQLPLTDKKETLSLWTFYANQYVDGPNDVLGVQKMEELTNVHINYNIVGTNEAVEKFGLLLASGNIPDIVYMAMATPTNGYTGGIEKGIEDGIFLDATPLIDQYMPNYKSLMEEYEEAGIGATTDTGLKVLYSFSANDAGLSGENEWCGMVIRKDWLDDLGLGIPSTLDEWHDALLAFKEQKGCEAPLMIGTNGPVACGAFLTAFDVLPGFYMEDGKVKYGPAEPGYKEYVDLMAQWYAEGLIDANFMTNGADLLGPSEYTATGRAGAFSTLYGFAMDNYVTQGLASEGFYLQAVANPVKNAGETPIGIQVADGIVNSMIGISADCKNPELAARWLDFQYTKEGMELNMYGVEGESYTVAEDGTYQFTDAVLNSPDGLSATDALKLYARGNGLGMYNWETGMRTYANYEDIVATEAVWTNQDRSLCIPKRTTMTEEEGNRYNSIYTNIQTTVQENTVKWIQGQMTTENFEQYVDNLYSYGLQECIDIQQAALDRYYDREKFGK